MASERGPSPTEEQRAAIESNEPRLVVSASAGSGKTYVLVRRYLRHVIEEGLSPDEVLTITFTRKAAAEMKRRIVDELLAHGRKEDAQRAETGPIQTIHSFFARLLRENAPEAGLDPDFTVLDDTESARLERRCIREAIADLAAEDERVREVLVHRAGLATYEGSPHSQLVRAVGLALSAFREAHVDPGELEASHTSPEAILLLWRRSLVDRWLTPEQAEQLGNLEGDDFTSRLSRVVGDRKHRWMRASPAEWERRDARTAYAVVKIACRAWRLYDEELNHLQSFDFTLLERLSVDLLRRSEVVRDRLARQYKVVLVDEAQDLSRIQHELLDLLPSDRRLLVGDPQQSIYGFRHAAVELFRQAEERDVRLRLGTNYRSDPQLLQFVNSVFGSQWAASYEPMAPPLKVVRAEDPFSEEAVGEIEVWYPRSRANMHEDHAAAVVDLLNDASAWGESRPHVTVLMRGGKAAQRLKNALDRKGVRTAIVGGSQMFYTRMEVRDLANALTALCSPRDDFALLSVLRSPMVGVSADAMVKLGVLRPLCEHLDTAEVSPEDRAKVTTFLEWYEELREYADRLSAWELIAQVLARSPLLENLAKRRSGRRQIANVRKLMGLAAARPEASPLEFAEDLRAVQRLRHTEGDAPDADQGDFDVTIMTMHKAKGLEFDVVAIPDLDYKMAGMVFEVLVDAECGLLMPNWDTGRSIHAEWMEVERAKRNVEEEWRVLYVAFTRARRRLCVGLGQGSQKATQARDLERILGCDSANPPPGAIQRPR